MNDICFTRCLIQQISDNGNYKVLSCLTKVPIESGGLIDATVFVYIDSIMFKEKNEAKNNPNIMTIGRYICITGKTVHEVKNNKIIFSTLIQNKRRIDNARTNFDVIVKLFDISVKKLNRIFNSHTNREEIIAEYSHSEKESNNNRRIIVSVNRDKVGLLNENTSYNLSGKFIIRISPTKNCIAVIVAETFVPDVVLSSSIYIKSLEI